MIKIPQNYQFSQTNEGEMSGNIYSTKNISFDEEGLIKLAKRTRAITDNTIITDVFTSPYLSFKKIINDSEQRKKFILGSKSLYYINEDSTNQYRLKVTKDVVSGTPVATTDEWDGVIFNRKLHIVQGGDLYIYDGDWATESLASGGQLITVFENKRCLAVACSGTGGLLSKIQLLDIDYAEQEFVELPSNMQIVSMTWNNNRLSIGTLDYSTNEAFLFEWDGSSAEANYGYPVNASNILCVAKYQDGVVLVTSKAEILYANGGLKRLAVFPIRQTDKEWSQEGNTIGNSLSYAGITVDIEKIYFSISSILNRRTGDVTDENYINNFPGGIWCYDPKVGLYHKHSIGQERYIATNNIATTDVNTGTGVITVAGATVPVTGTPVFYDPGSLGDGTKITPLLFNTRYFVIKVSDTTLKLATTKSNALAGTAITLTSTGNAVQCLYFCPNGDFGGAGDRVYTNIPYRKQGSIQLPTSMADDFFILGQARKSADGAVVYTVNATVDKQENRGYFITPRLKSTNTGDVFNEITIKHKPFVYEDDKIIVKYRVNKPELSLRMLQNNTPLATWTSATTFTTTDYRFSEAVIGYELEIVSGAGAGYIAHITDISLDSGTYTVTIDETIENISNGNKFYFVVDNWTKIMTLDKTNSINISETQIGEVSTWLQVKTELRGINTTIEEIMVDNVKH